MAPQNDRFRLLRRIPDLRFEEVPQGYSKEQVNRVLDNLAQLYEEVERLQARLAEAETRAASAESRLVEARSPSNARSEVPPLPNPDFDETLRNTLVSAQRTADTMVKEAKEEATRLQSEAELQSSALLDDARSQSEEMTAEAVAYRDKLMSEAEDERVEVTLQNQEELEERKKAIELELNEAHEAERESLLSQIASLQDTHQVLQDDVERFESHIGNRQEAIRSAIADLTEVVEDPSSLRPVDPPEPADVAEINEADYPEIGIESPALEELGSRDAGNVEPNGMAHQTSHEEDAASTAEIESPLVDPASFDGDEATHNSGIADLDKPPVEATPPNPSRVAASGADPFLEELRRVTNEDPSDGDPITNFLEDESPNSNSGGWFGRRK